jgi:hypothetical protein
VTLTEQGVRQLFEEQIGRPIDAATAARVVENISSVIHDLNEIDPLPLFWVEPSIVFDPTYPEQEESGAWLIVENY